MNRIEEAVQVLREGANVDPANADIKGKLTELETQSEKLRKFVDAQGKPLTGVALAKAEGNELFKNSKYEEAATCYGRALEGTTDPKERSVLFSNRAACWAQYQNWDRMLGDAKLALEADPKNVKALIRRGLAYEGLEKYKLAADDFKSVLELDPQAMVASTALARLSRFLNR